MKLKDSFHLYAIITILSWSLSYVFTRMTLHYFSAFSLGFLRFFVASCSLVVLAILFKMKMPKKVDLKWFFAAGAVGFFIFVIAFNKGCKTVTSSTSSVVIATAPVITALLSRLIYKERLSFVKWAAIAIEFIGVVVLTLMDGIFTINIGLIWLLLAATALSFYNLLQRNLTKTYSALQISTYSIFAGTMMLAVFLPVSLKEVQSAPPIQFLYIAILGIFPSAIAYVAWARAFAKTEQISAVSNYMFLTPFFASLLGFVFANEKLDLPTIVGGTIILFGVLVFNFGENWYARLSKKHNETEVLP
ncbi:MAG: DMT family transporter [Clostridiales bacterium]|nr:DMT family transporter [Clostridiales bacterium]